MFTREVLYLKIIEKDLMSLWDVPLVLNRLATDNAISCQSYIDENYNLFNIYFR